MQLTLMEYIKLKFNGDLYRYAQFEGISREQLLEWLENEYYVVKGKVVRPVKHLPVVNHQEQS